MKLTITTLVIIEDTTDLSVPEISICYHSFFEDIEKAKKEIIDDVNQVYAPGVKFETIEHNRRILRLCSSRIPRDKTY